MARILVIDDDQATLSLERKILSDAGYEVLSCSDCLGALDLLKVHEMDLVIADIQMPRFNGLQFMTTLKRDHQLHGTSVAFLTASSDADVVAHAAKLGADFYIVKPIDRRRFVERIASFFEKKPAKVHAKVEFEQPISTTIKTYQNVQVISVSDICVDILTDQELQEDQLVELPSSAFNEIFHDDPLFKVVWVKPHEGHQQRARLIFLDGGIERVRKIQKFIHSKSQDPALLKYPKWR